MNAKAVKDPLSLETYPEPELLARLLEQAAAFPHDTWIQGSEARDAAGRECYPFQEEAVSFCAIGRLNKVCHQQRAPDPVRTALARALLTVLPPGAGDLQLWNDQPGRTPQEVRELFQKAATRIREQG